MADEMPVCTGGTDVGKKLWDMHQKDEWKRVNKHKEGFCWKCDKKKAVSATIVDVCPHCSRNRGNESMLVALANKGYAQCSFCGHYKWDVYQVNVRLCHNCHYDVRETNRETRRAGGAEKVDPFYKSLRRKHGKDWRILMGQPKSWRA